VNAVVTGVAEPFFFDSTQNARLFGVWRPAACEAAAVSHQTVWVLCPPFAEEEKSAHRTLVELCEALRQHGQPSLYFAYRGTGDSSGDFAAATLAGWRSDLLAACAEARRRAPGARLGLLGLRLGASLAMEMASEVSATGVISMEPILNGRQYVGAMSKRKSLRAMMTQQEGAQSGVVAPTPEPAAAVAMDDSGIDDFDGWGIGRPMRAELEALDLANNPPKLPVSPLLLQIGPREQIAAPLQTFAAATGAEVAAVTMQPFWNLLDYVRADALAAIVVNYSFTASG